MIDKAQTNASLLAEIIAASTDEILDLRDFENSEVIQVCQSSWTTTLGISKLFLRYTLSSALLTISLTGGLMYF